MSYLKIIFFIPIMKTKIPIGQQIEDMLQILGLEVINDGDNFDRPELG